MTPFYRNLGVIALCLSPTTAFAGAGAEIQACIYMPKQPSTPWMASFTVGGPGTRCMSSNGNDVAFQVTSAGSYCGNIGYVAATGSDTKGDTCATGPSNWILSYTGGQGSGYAGSTSVEMASELTRNAASLSHTTAGTVICTSAALCSSTSQDWGHDSQGPLYIIFQPLAAAN